MKQTFYLKKASLYYLFIGLAILALGKWLIEAQPNLLIYQHAIIGMLLYLLEENYGVLSFFILVYVPIAVLISRQRLIVTETDFIYQGLIKKQVFPKKDYRIVGKGSFKEETGSGDNSSTERWKQLDVVDQTGAVSLVIKSTASKKNYQKIVTFLRVDELAQSKEDSLTAQPSINEELDYCPKSDPIKHYPWGKWLFSIILIAIIAGVMDYVVNHYPYMTMFLTKSTRAFILIFFIGRALIRNIDWSKKAPLTQLVVKAESLIINDYLYLDSNILLVELTSSEEDLLRHDYYLSMVYRDGGRKRKKNYEFKLKSDEMAQYKEIEQAIVKKYGVIGKYQMLMAEV